jgi:hypothetical protein
MTQAKSGKKTKPKAADPFRVRANKDAGRHREPHVHVYGQRVICATDKRGHSTPRGLSPLEIVVDASQGFIPLWAKDVTLRWRFQERAMSAFTDPRAAKAAIRRLLGEALLAWGDAAPLKFAEREDAWDFEIIVRTSDDCDPNGCVLASAFFPDAGRHQLAVYPKMFTQDKKEQVDTLIHELGHVFGLRHFFAQVSETTWPSEVFGAHKPFSIMNYGAESTLTEDDKSDLKQLYQSAWNGDLTHINGTPIRFFKPFSAVTGAAHELIAVARVRPIEDVLE